MKKRIFPFILMLTVLLSSMPFTAGAQVKDIEKSSASYLIGDANGDNQINVKDATLIQKHAAKITTISGDSFYIADVTGDNLLNVKDATAIQKYIAKIINSFDRITIPGENSNTNEYGLAKNLEQGSIFHAWCWSFNTIRENLDNIAASGFTSIQTSPISQCKVGEDGGMEIYGAGKWYYHYQPTKFAIGNYQLGTKEEFTKMCDEAHKRGMNIIVDAVVNHCSSDYDAIDSSVKNISGGAFHPYINWSQENRYYETQGQLSLLWDLNTQNPNVQSAVKDFLVRIVNAGADGFRYDTAKLIELPDDSVSGQPSFASNFWPTVLDNGAKWQYGENLQDAQDNSVCRLSEYAKYMDVTASKYGEKIREAVNTDNLSAEYIEDYLVDGLSPDSLVTWVESHDNYCNENTWEYIDEQESVRAWAIICARKGGTPLYFSRPMNSTSENPWGNNKIGEAGSDLYKDLQIAQVNFFRNEMGDSPEYLSNPQGNSKVLMIERGDSGFVIVNASDSDVTLADASVKSVKDGTYKDRVSGKVFTVQNGKLSGTISAGRVSVAFEGDYTPLEYTPIVTSSVASSRFFEEELSVTLIGKNCTDLTYKINSGAETPFNDGDTLLLGKNLSDGEKVTLTVKGYDKNGTFYKNEFTYTKCILKGDTVVYADKKAFSSWGDIYCYVYNDDGTTNGEWPGVKMTYVGNEKYMYTLPYDLEKKDSYVIFNNGYSGTDNQYPEESGLLISSGQKKFINYMSVWEDYPLKTVYFKNTLGWENVNVYFWGEENTSWPGCSAGKVEGTEDIYMVSLYGDRTSVIFNDGGVNQTRNIDCFIDGQIFTPDGNNTVDKYGQKIYSGELSGYVDSPLPPITSGYKQVYFRSMSDDIDKENSVYLNISQNEKIKMVYTLNSKIWTAQIPESTDSVYFTVNNSKGELTSNISAGKMGSNNCFTALGKAKGVWNKFSTGEYDTSFTVYFDNSKCNYSDVYIYAWGNDGLNGFAKMDYVEGSIYSYTFINTPEKGVDTFLFADGNTWSGGKTK
ncbi:MAG: starch-binding protein, partial [Acutalibacteraceae bacterium]